MHGGTSVLDTRFRRLLALLGFLFVGSTVALFVLPYLQSGRTAWDGGAGGEAALRRIGLVLLTTSCAFLSVGSTGLLVGRGPWVGRVLFAGAICWTLSAIVIISLQVNRILGESGVLREVYLAIYARAAEQWLVMTGALPLLLLVFAWWPEVTPGEAWAPAQLVGAERPSFPTRLMRVLSVYGIVFGAGILLVDAMKYRWSLPHLRLPRSFPEAFTMAGGMLESGSAGLMIAGAIAELFARRWGRPTMLIAAAAWIGASLASLGGDALLDLGRGRLLTTGWTLYGSRVSAAVSRSAFPLMLVVCLRWREMRAATGPEASAGFQPILSPARTAEEAQP